MLLRLYQAERPRGVLVVDTLEAPTYRHEAIRGVSERPGVFDDALIEQLATIPQFVSACGFANAQAPGTSR